MGNKAGSPAQRTTCYSAAATGSGGPPTNAASRPKSGKEVFNAAIGHNATGNRRRGGAEKAPLVMKKKKSVRFDASAGPLLMPEEVDQMYARAPGGKPPQKWNKEQDAALRVAVEKYGGKNWKAIAAMVPGRNHVQCLQRWKKVLKPGLVKGHWTEEEDAKLMELVKHPSLENWAMVAQHVPGRTAKQCRERWSLNLDPSINRGPWTPVEDELLLKLQAEKGNKWAELSTHLPGRTENAVKTRYKSLMRARAREWTPAEDAKLIQARQELGRRWTAIAQLLSGRSKNAVKTRWKYLVKNDENLSRMYAGQSSGSSAGPAPAVRGPSLAAQPKALLRKTTSQLILGEVLAEYENPASLSVPPVASNSAPQAKEVVGSWGEKKKQENYHSFQSFPSFLDKPAESTAPPTKTMRSMYSDAPFFPADALDDFKFDGFTRSDSAGSESDLPSQHRLARMFSSGLLSTVGDGPEKVNTSTKQEKPSMLRRRSSGASSFNRDFALFDTLDVGDLPATPDFDML